LLLEPTREAGSGPAETAGPPSAFASLRGRIVQVDGAKVIVKAWTRDDTGEEATVVTDDKTAVTVGNSAMAAKPATVADLKPGMYVFVFPPTGTATRINATIRPPEER
jgi:hypothetical protein